ncbi:Peptidyl-prolyl cis-trans isomerase cyp18 [BD1-7 clade bacterium]|uniref:Peptidyl-prolyl cis-trans isomerase n=1 Tax=BD1-7 clade bacterium TaxID=2029982 RepID=A0A5S9QGB4_9GAMM|nr:Peptidyl-prolyl cis-trans isomerase cyp18 [BD1-7 clade bacterium]CAA0117072.1 Peptidyl-prolyl cis-trans isomerase cyp18 [BD1-7 clade bacterium]
MFKNTLKTLLLSSSMLISTLVFANPHVEFETSEGNFTVELYPDKAPKSVENFLKYVNKGFYNGTIFHRVIDGFMIQGGGFEPDMLKKKPGAPIQNEADNGLRNNYGTIAMARTNDPHSATAQFFVNVEDNQFLNHSAKTMRGWGYTVFGKVSKGMDTITKIKKVQTSRRGPFQNVPVQDVVIKQAHVIAEKPAKAEPANDKAASPAKAANGQ